MGGGATELKGPDLAQGIPEADLAESKPLLGHAQGEPVVLVRKGKEVFAVGASCTHYGGPLADGIVVGEEVRCPYHHAAFSLRTGENLRPPARDRIPTWKVVRDGALVKVTGKAGPGPQATLVPSAPGNIVIVGAGAAGQVAAETLRNRSFLGKITLVGEEQSGPVDRPNLSKDYLAGNAPEEWIPLRPKEWYAENDVELVLGTSAKRLDLAGKAVELADGRKLSYSALILATGAEPVRLPIPGAELPHVFTLRSLADSRAIIERAKTAKKAVVIGSSFIGLEAAASLRARNVEVHVVGPDALPLAKVLGEAMGTFLKGLHESKGVVFHLGRKPASIDATSVTLDNGEKLAADLVVMGVGVKPRTQLAEAAGLKVEDGVVVDAQLQTSAPNVFACGDIARWPDPYTGKTQRIEHWVLAQRQAVCAALNAMGKKERFAAAPFFWSQHYDVPVAYVGFGKGWDAVEVKGDIAGRDCAVAYKQSGKVVAVATIYRDQVSLEVEAAIERGDAPAVADLASR